MSHTFKHSHIQLAVKDSISDLPAKEIMGRIRANLGIETGKVKVSKLFQFLDLLEEGDLCQFANKVLRDPVIHDVYVNRWYSSSVYQTYILISKLPGMTDDEGMSAQKALNDFLGLEIGKAQQKVFSQSIYLLEKPLKLKELKKIAYYLGNPVIHHFDYGQWLGSCSNTPKPILEKSFLVDVLDVSTSDDALMQLSKERHLSLNLDEMRAIQNYFDDSAICCSRQRVGLSKNPTDCEIEILAQTWSEHCKHKEFNALIKYRDLDTSQEREISSLFNSKIKAATEYIANRLKEKGHDWLVKVFSDNAGIVKVDDEQLFVWKVETHNTPSALDPYGGAITGILGNNRDALGTGIGGAKLLFNTNVLCFASPFYDKPLLKGQLAPIRILRGVVEGIRDGGNKSGIPTVNGSIVFDERFCGKPLVFCGTGALMPKLLAEKESWHKVIHSGDRIIMAGGRVGKDGIHGATLSSSYVDINTPQNVVQIGSPMTQKLLADFLEEACRRGLVKTSTDNGAGGLSSSVGEMAQISGGAKVFLEKVPLKYSGLRPWEIFVSESQERMTLVVEEKLLDNLFVLAKEFSVELSDIGCFTSSGFLHVYYQDNTIAYLDLNFLHFGLPQKHMFAEWKKPSLKEPLLNLSENCNDHLLNILSALNVCSKELVIRQYDHEVKGKSTVKPLMGPKGYAPQDAAVLRLNQHSWKGLIISNGILPRYGDIDPYHMSAGAFDEAVRQIISVGGSLPDLDRRKSSFWSVNDNFCVPDSLYDPQGNPDGKYKLAQLVRMCDALYDISTAYLVPLTSGKDSMKNDFRDGDMKISIPPTVLYSMVSQVDDIRLCTTTEFKMPNDKIYLLGETYDELGASEFYQLFKELGSHVPCVRSESAIDLYRRVSSLREKSLLESCHDISDGGLAVCLAECAFGGDLGAEIDLCGENLHVALFSESHSRFIVSVKEENSSLFEKFMGKRCFHLGRVVQKRNVLVRWKGKTVIDLSIDQLVKAWKGGLEGIDA